MKTVTKCVNGYTLIERRYRDVIIHKNHADDLSHCPWHSEEMIPQLGIAEIPWRTAGFSLRFCQESHSQMTENDAESGSEQVQCSS